MIPPRFVLRGATAAALLLLLAPLRGADDPLDALPAETGVLLRLAAPAELSGKMKAFLNKSAPQFAAVADQAGPALGSLIGNPTLVGVDAGRPWYVTVTPRSEGSPAIVYAVPAADAAALKKAVGQGYTFADFQNWVVYSLDAEAMKGVQTRVGGQGKSVREGMPEPLKQVFAKGEIGSYLNVARVREAYKAKIEQARDQIAKAAEGPAGANPTLKAGMEYNRKVLETLLKAIDDTEGFAKGVTIGESALSAEAVAVVKSGSESAGFLAKQTTSDLPLLAKLPRGRIAYFGAAGDLTGLIAASSQMTAGLYPQNEDLTKRLEELKKFRFGEVVGEFELGTLESGVYRGVSLAKVDRPQEYLGVARELLKAMGELENAGVRQDVSVKPEAETVEGVKVDLVKVAMTPDPKADPTGASKRVLEVMFGKEGMTQRMAVVDGLFVQGVGGADVMAAAVKAVRGQATGDETAQKAADAARAALDGKTNLLVLLDLPRLLGGGLQLAVESKQLPLPIDPQAVANLNLAPSYTGWTVTAAKEEVRFRWVMPAEQVRGMVELFRVLQQAAPNRAR